jgi:hypothetical protein
VGLALGVMDRHHLHALDRRHYDRAQRYASDDHNLLGLFDWEREAVDRWFGECRSIAVVGAGGGREVLALCREGVAVDGFECNEKLVRVAERLLNAHGGPARFVALPRDAAPPAGVRYDGLVVGWSAYMLIPGRAGRVRFLTELAASGQRGAPLLLSFFTRTDGDRRLHHIARVASLVRRVRRGAAVEPGDDLAPNYVHRFIEQEVRSEMRDAGFTLLAFSPQQPGPFASGWAVGRLGARSPE